VLEEHVLLSKILAVGSDQLSVVGQGSTGSIFYFEVLHSFGNLLESRRVIDLDNSRIEHFLEMSLDLRGFRKIVVSFFLENFSNSYTCGFKLGQVVKEE